MCAITRSGQVVAEWARVERCLYVNWLRRLRRVEGEMGEEVKGCEEDILPEGECYLGMLDLLEAIVSLILRYGVADIYYS